MTAERRRWYPAVPPALALALAVAIALVAGGCGSTASDAPAERATLLLDFAPNAVHTGIYSATRRGFDDAEGLALRVRVPGQASDPVRLLLTGRVDFAVLDIHDLALARQAGRDLVGVMAIVQRPLAAVLTRHRLERPRDLEGRRVGVTGLPSDVAVLRSIVRGDGGDPRHVRTVTIGFRAVQALLARKVDGATAFWNVEGVALRRRIRSSGEFRVDEYGAPAYPELVLVTTRETLDDRPATVEAVVRALARGYEFVLDDPTSGAEDLVAGARGLDRDEVKAQLSAVGSAFEGPEGRVGVLSRERLDAWARWEAEFGITREPPDVAAAFDGRFVPGG